MTDPDVVDGTTAEDQPTAELAVRDRSSEVLKPVDAGELLESFHAYQELVPRLLSPTDYQAAERGKRFVKKSGWRKIARAFRLNCEVIRIDVERDDQGQPVRATAIVRATAPNGDFQEGDGHCSITEARFTGRGRDQALSKAENDLPATAITRAKNRAISDLVGMGEVSAEEADAYSGEAAAPEPEAWTLPSSRTDAQQTGTALRQHLELEQATELWKAVAKMFPQGKVPAGVAVGMRMVAEAIHDKPEELANRVWQQPPWGQR